MAAAKGRLEMAASGHRCRGTALIEFAFIIPFIAFFLTMVFFFGWAMRNQQHVKISDRYTAWRDVRPKPPVTGTQLNARFFRDEAGGVSIGRGTGPTDTIRDLAAAAGGVSGAAEDLAVRVAVEGGFPRGKSARVAARFPPGIDAWRHLTSAIGTETITHRHAREGLEWRCRNGCFCDDVLLDQYLRRFDRELPPSGANGLANVVRITYTYKWRHVQVEDD